MGNVQRGRIIAWFITNGFQKISLQFQHLDSELVSMTCFFVLYIFLLQRHREKQHSPYYLCNGTLALFVKGNTICRWPWR